MGDMPDASPTYSYVEGAYKGIGSDAAENDSEALSRQIRAGKGPSVMGAIFSDIVSELFDGKGAIMWSVKSLPWRLHFKGLVQFRYSDEITRADENIRRIAVLGIPTFPTRTGDLQLLKISFLHVRKLTQESIASIMTAAVRSRTKMMSHRQSEVRDTCVVVIADEQDKGANVKLQAQARVRGEHGSRIAYVFAAKRGAYIRKLLYQFLCNFFTKRAEAVKSKAEATLAKMGAAKPEIYGDLKLCCEFVAGLGKALESLSAKIKLAWGSRKTKAEQQRDRMGAALHEHDRDAEMKEARAKMRELAKVEMARRDKAKKGAAT